MKLIAMIVARSRSDRFPDKSVALVDGVPMIGRILKQLRQIKEFDQIILATTGLTEDDYLCKVATKYKVHGIFRGAENNMLSRRIGCCQATEATHFMCISGDSPFIDVDACRFYVKAFFEHNDSTVDYFAPFAYTCNVGATPYGGTIHSVHSLEMYEKFFYRYPKFNDLLEHYWAVDSTDEFQAEIDPLFKKVWTPFDDYMPPESTPIKTSIDYPLELAFWNRIIKIHGRYPKNTAEIYQMFRTIREI